jgi:hypothetical protein
MVSLNRSLSMLRRVAVLLVCALTVALALAWPGPVSSAKQLDGRSIFRFDTFGDEQLWTDTLRMHEVIASAVSPATALSVGLKVDATVLPPGFLATHDLNDPATTVELIRRNAVVGIVGKVRNGKLKSVGITCAICHSTVDDSVTAGIGARRDGWANTDLNPGAIIALSPALTDAQKAVYNSWGPGKYDPRFNQDGINLPVVIPPAYGLQGVGFETFTGDGPISYWNNYVAVTQMGGHGSFSDPRLGIDITQIPDQVRPKLPALLEYQLSLATPTPPSGSFDRQAAGRGRLVFNGAAGCVSCHQGSTYTDVLAGPDPSVPVLHDPSETGMEAQYAARSATGRYRTTPLRGLWQHAPYFHDGSAPTLEAVVDHYIQFLGLVLTDAEKADLVQFLKSL